MKKIGYIYKYNPLEGMGILVFGTWKVKTSWGASIIKNSPILFSSKELLTEVSTGQLVYFDLDDNVVSNIERASLSNFKIDYINSIIKCGKLESEYSFYNDNAIISFERLDNIIIPRVKESELLQETTRKKNPLEDSDEDWNFDFFDDDFEYTEESFDDSGYEYYDDDTEIIHTTEINQNASEETAVQLPELVKDLYGYLGKYKHLGGEECSSLNVFDLSLWVDPNILDTEYYGKNVEELKFLYDVFVLKKRYDRNGNEISVKIDNDSISPVWSLLLSKFSSDDLVEIRYVAPKLQPAFPVEFCKNNVGILTDEYGMPNVELCKLYCLHKIASARTISEYRDIKHKLFIYCNCNANHLVDEGTPMCQLGKRRINSLKKHLEERYENVIKKDIFAQIKSLSDSIDIEKELRSSTSDEIASIGYFLDKYNELINDFFGYGVCEKLKESYEKLPDKYKDALRTSLYNCVNTSAIEAAKDIKESPFRLSYQIELLGDWIYDSTKQQIKKLVNEKFSKLDDLEDLSCAYKCGYITGAQYLRRYKQLTCDFNAYQFLKELTDYRMEDSPLTIQWYIVLKIINLLGYDSLRSFNYIRVDYYDSISDIRSLIKWLNNYGHLNDVVLKKAEERICSVLSSDERWTLFKEKIVKSPGLENIRKRLNLAYKKKYASEKLFQHRCFQDVMLSDVDKIKDPEILLFIADHLDSEHRFLMQQKTEGFLKLYLWQKQPSGNFDWNLVKSHYHELKSEAQIRTLRYIFGLISSGDSSLSIDDLYMAFVESTTPACSAICGILFLLKAKIKDLNLSITSAMLETVIGSEFRNRFNFLKDSKELFYPCNGYIALTPNQQDTEYLSFNGILTKEAKNDKLYYVITFYDTPVNLFGRTIEWLDSEEIEIAEQVLTRNLSVEFVNGKYYIPASKEFFVKQYVMSYGIDDKCGLISDKESLIELGFLPRNNAYQPLYLNFLRKYEDSDYYICRCGCIGGSDPNNNIPFFWCQKKICVRRPHFLKTPTQWERYRFADLLFIAMGQKFELRDSVWSINAEISQFICDYTLILKSSERDICSAPLNESNEIGIWHNESTTFRDIYDDYDDDEDYCDEEDYYDEVDWNESPTYERYGGSWAQDEAGYSDDDIDTIFDGDPSAYWNID